MLVPEVWSSLCPHPAATTRSCAWRIADSVNISSISRAC
jgi:hypothetical protein